MRVHLLLKYVNDFTQTEVNSQLFSKNKKKDNRNNITLIELLQKRNQEEKEELERGNRKKLSP